MPPNPPKRLSRGGSPHGVVRGGVVRTPPLHLSPAHLPSAYLPPALLAPPPQLPAGMGTPLREGVFWGGGGQPPGAPLHPQGAVHTLERAKPPSQPLQPPPPALQAGHRPRVARVCVQLGTRRFAHTCTQVHTHAHACPYRCACVCTHARRRTRMCSWFWGARGSQRVPQSPRCSRPPPTSSAGTPPQHSPLLLRSLRAPLLSPCLPREATGRGFGTSRAGGQVQAVRGGDTEGDIAGTRVRVETK